MPSEAFSIAVSIEAAMALKGAQLYIGAIDKMNKATDRADKKGGESAKKTENANKRKTSSVNQLISAQRRLVKSSATTGTSFFRLAAQVLSASTAFIAMRNAVRNSLRVIIDFERTMSEVFALLGTRGGVAVFQQLTEEVRQLGATTIFTAREAAEGLKFLVLAGFDAQEAIQGLAPALQLAIAGNLSLGDSADIASNIMQAFNVEASMMRQSVDALATVASRSNTSIRQLGDAFQYAGNVAGTLGITIPDAAAALGVLGNSGLQATIAGTGLRRVISSLLEPTARASRVLQGLGLESVNWGDILTQPGGIITAVERLADASLSAGEAMQIFGLRGGPSILALVGAVDTLKELTDAANNSAGAVELMAARMQDNLFGQLRAVTSAVQEMILSVGDAGLTEGFRNLLVSVTGLVRGLAGFNAEGERVRQSTVATNDALRESLRTAEDWAQRGLEIRDTLVAMNIGLKDFTDGLRLLGNIILVITGARLLGGLNTAFVKSAAQVTILSRVFRILSRSVVRLFKGIGSLRNVFLGLRLALIPLIGLVGAIPLSLAAAGVAVFGLVKFFNRAKDATDEATESLTVFQQRAMEIDEMEIGGGNFRVLSREVERAINFVEGFGNTLSALGRGQAVDFVGNLFGDSGVIDNEVANFVQGFEEAGTAIDALRDKQRDLLRQADEGGLTEGLESQINEVEQQILDTTQLQEFYLVKFRQFIDGLRESIVSRGLGEEFEAQFEGLENVFNDLASAGAPTTEVIDGLLTRLEDGAGVFTRLERELNPALNTLDKAQDNFAQFDRFLTEVLEGLELLTSQNPELRAMGEGVDTFIQILTNTDNAEDAMASLIDVQHGLRDAITEAALEAEGFGEVLESNNNFSRAFERTLTREEKLMMEYTAALEDHTRVAEEWANARQELNQHSRGIITLTEREVFARQGLVESLRESRGSLEEFLALRPELVDFYEAQLEALTPTNNALQELNDLLLDIHGAQNEGVAAARRYNDQILALKAAAEAANLSLDDFPDTIMELQRQFEQSFEGIEDEALEVADTIEDEFSRAIQKAINRIDRAFAEMWGTALDGFDDFREQMKQAFNQLIGELIHIAVTKPILINAGVSLGGLGGAGGAAASAGGSLVAGAAGGAGGALGAGAGLGAVFGALQDGITNIFDASLFTEAAGPLLPGQTADQILSLDFQNIGTNLAAGFLGNLTGGKLAEAIFNKEANSNIGATLGGIIGSVIPGLGTFLGSAIGASLDVVFGGDGNVDVAAGFKLGANPNQPLLSPDTPTREGANQFRVDPFASGLAPVGFAERADNSQAQEIIEIFRRIDETFVGISRAGGITVDFSQVDFSGGAGLRGSNEDFFGLAGENQLGAQDLEQQTVTLLRQYFEAVSDQLTTEVKQAVDEAENSAVAILEAYAEALSIQQLIDDGAVRILADQSFDAIEALAGVAGGAENLGQALTALNGFFDTTEDGITESMMQLRDIVSGEFARIGLDIEMFGNDMNAFRDYFVQVQESLEPEQLLELIQAGNAFGFLLQQEEQYRQDLIDIQEEQLGVLGELTAEEQALLNQRVRQLEIVADLSSEVLKMSQDLRGSIDELLGIELFDNDDFQRVRELQDEYDAIIEANSELVRLRQNEHRDAVRNYDAQIRLAQNLHNSIIDLQTGDFSPFSSEERQSTAQAEFDRLLELARGGDVEAGGQLSSVAERLLQINQERFATSEQGVSNARGIIEELASVQSILADAAPPPDFEEQSVQLSEEQTIRLREIRDELVGIEQAVSLGLVTEMANLNLTLDALPTRLANQMRGVIEENFGFGVDGSLDGLRALADSVGSVTAVADLIGGTSVEATVNATLAEDNLTLSDFQTGGRFDDLHRQQLHDAVVEEIRVSTDNTEVVSAITDQTDTTREVVTVQREGNEQAGREHVELVGKVDTLTRRVDDLIDVVSVSPLISAA